MAPIVSALAVSTARAQTPATLMSKVGPVAFAAGKVKTALTATIRC